VRKTRLCFPVIVRPFAFLTVQAHRHSVYKLWSMETTFFNILIIESQGDLPFQWHVRAHVCQSECCRVITSLRFIELHNYIVGFRIFSSMLRR